MLFSPFFSTFVIFIWNLQSDITFVIYWIYLILFSITFVHLAKKVLFVSVKRSISFSLSRTHSFTFSCHLYWYCNYERVWVDVIRLLVCINRINWMQYVNISLLLLSNGIKAVRVRRQDLYLFWDGGNTIVTLQPEIFNAT